MLKIPLNDIIVKIKEKTQLDEGVINKKIEDKVNELSGLVSKEGAAHIIANEFGIKLFQPTSSGRLQIKNIISGLRNVSFLGRVLEVSPVREFKTEKKEGKVVSLLLGDETGKIRVVFWDTNHIKLVEDGELTAGAALKIEGGYVRESKIFDGVEVHTSSTSRVVVNPEDPEVAKLPSAEAVKDTTDRVRIADITEGRKEIRGAIVNVFESNPFFDICPQCNKRAREATCAEHGQVTPKKSLVLSTIIDDGSDNMRVVFFGNRAEQVLGMSADEAFKLSEEHGSDILYPIQQKKMSMLGREVIVEGNVNTNSFSGDLEMIARSIQMPNTLKESKDVIEQINT